MRHHDSSGAVSPVLDGVFPDGQDTVLLSPAMTARRWRRRQALTALRLMTVLKGLSCAGAAVLASVVGHGFGEKLALAVAAMTLVLAGWRVASRLIADGRDHYDGVPQTRVPRGEGFRSRDFADLGASSLPLVQELLSGVDELHRTPARAWIDPGLPGEAHRVVWQALCCLDRSRDARALADELASDPDAGDDLASAARRAVDEIDDSLDEVARHVRGCLVLARAWEAKLRRQDLAARTRRTLAALPGHDRIRGLSRDAEALPQNVFAHVTAARDITRAGEFPWERPRSTWPRPPLFPLCPGPDSPTTQDRS
ncbi:hypothetical protein [Amycolatopsis sp. cmx-11-32]|uniref:hypothetical protein n=1 Tax=Amycolatopsis sp. cmx-11-32 TaxID=2785796 RepID=UPI0039E431B2